MVSWAIRYDFGNTKALYMQITHTHSNSLVIMTAKVLTLCQIIRHSCTKNNITIVKR